jgi:hypothetical protein
MAESWQPQKSQPKPQRRSRQRRSRNKNILWRSILRKQDAGSQMQKPILSVSS